MDRKNKADKLFLGNIITLDSRYPMFEALTVKDGLVQYVGSEEIARKLCDDKTIVMDYGDSYIYPGMIESHCHPEMAGQRFAVQADLTSGKTMDDYVEIMRKFIAADPGREQYLGAGWLVRDKMPCAAMLDAICPDKPVVLNSVDGHSMWLNTAALECFNIDDEAVRQWGTDVVRVDVNGKPNGYISEGPVNQIITSVKVSREDKKKGLLAWQEFAFKNGFTAVMDAGMTAESIDILHELIEEGKWKLRTYGSYYVGESSPDYVVKVTEAAAARDKYDCEYYRTIGMKVFMDGVVEAHTAWLQEEYSDAAGGFGVKRLCDHDRFVELLRAAEKEGFNVHCHTIGDGAVEFALGAIEQVEVETGNMNMRNALAHLQVVTPEQIQKIADLNVVAVVAPLWSPLNPDYIQTEIDYLGRARNWNTYPVKSFYDKHAIVAFHSDFPVSAEINIPLSIYTAIMRKKPENGMECQRNYAECITADEAVAGLTQGPAYSVFQEDHLGSLMIGYAANMTIYDKNFFKCDVEEIAEAKLVATVVDGDEVYRS